MTVSAVPVAPGDPTASNLADALARALGAALSPAAADFAAQASGHIEPGDLPELDTVDMGRLLADFWRFAEARTGVAPSLRLHPALDASGAPLGFDLMEAAQDDSPFLVDSLMGELAAHGLEIRAMVHPVVAVPDRADPQSLILVALAPVGEDRRQAVLQAVSDTLADVHAAVDDFPAMTALMRHAVAELGAARVPPQPYGLDEHIAFLRWLGADHFVFLGARSYDYPRGAKGQYLREEPTFDPAHGLGLLRDPARSVFRRENEPAFLTADLKAYMASAPAVTVAKSNLRTRVHRRTHLDYVGVRRYGPDGTPVGEIRFVGLFTAEAYEEPARALPLIRRKIETVLAHAADLSSAHAGRRLRHIVETYPRDELFQIDDAALLKTALGILHLHDRPRVRLFVWKDPFERFQSILLFVPRDRYHADTPRRAADILARAFGGRVSAVYPRFGDEAMARMHVIIGLDPGDHPAPDVAALELEIAEALRSWSDRFEARLRDGTTPDAAIPAVLARYGQAFPAGYRDRYGADEALSDLPVIEALAQGEGEPLRVRPYRLPDDAAMRLRFKLYVTGGPAPLSDVLPIVEHMGLRGLDEAGFAVHPAHEDTEVWVHEYLLEDAYGREIAFDEVASAFEAAFVAVWTGRAESDGFNRLVLELGVSWREAALIRALARWRQQSGLDPSQAVQEAALRTHPGVARLILDLFRIKFDPAVRASLDQRREQADEVHAEIEAALQAVQSLDDDRVLRRLAQAVRAMTRTNYFQLGDDGCPKPYISFKIASREVEALPAPKPYREVFVASGRVDGVHTRFGPVARGGLRWSDRRDDFRTEVLGLVKAQQVKNAVIVPVGAKGCFYPKRLPREGADAIRAEAVEAYKTFLSGVLDVTDNLDAEGKVIHPAGVVVHDGDDPYLVVAADKGTATFSDIANGVARDYGFWLDDAFASGGSKGYDHKAMGITAKGAWEAVKRHFRELDKDIQTEPFTCIGVGDMSGDVFGNGMLLSKATKLVAAFDHRHIFLDPDPDVETSWSERNRLFALPRSSWADYDAKLLSKGGGIFPRSAKTVALTPEIRALLQIEDEELAPADLIRAVLKAPAELLYLGGVGTYVKAPAESHADVSDKANDPVRVDATELRVKVVGEGANLGFTQAGRIAFARTGGKNNTDAIDNSAGVDTSDHEVNIKILTGQAIKAGSLKAEDRDVLLASMTDDIAAHVLAHNYAQTLALSLQEAEAVDEIDGHARFMADLVAKGRLDRKVEGLPGPAALAELKAQGKGLTRPELAVVLAYSKLELSAEIVGGAAPDDPYFEQTLKAYFPDALAPFEAEMKRHRLRREIIATVLANAMVDMVGPTFVSRVQGALGCDAAVVATAFEVARRMFRLNSLWRQIAELDLKVPAKTQLALFQEVAQQLRAQTYWLARRAATKGAAPVQDMINAYRPSIDALYAAGTELLDDRRKADVGAHAQGYVDAGVPDKIARAVAGLSAMRAAVEVADLAREAGWSPEAVARLYGAVGASLGFDRLRDAAAGLAATDGYERRAARQLIVDMVGEQTTLARAVMAEAKEAGDPKAAIAAWAEPRQPAIDRAQAALDEIEAGGEAWTFARLTLAHSALRQGLG